MALTLQDLLIPTPGPIRPDTRGQTGPADPASDAFAALFNSATPQPQAPDAAPPHRDGTTRVDSAQRPRHDDRSPSETKPSADSDANKPQSDGAPTKVDAKDGDAPAKPTASAHHHHRKADSGQPQKGDASADSTTADNSSASASTGSTPSTPAGLFQVLLLASQPNAATPSPPSGTATAQATALDAAASIAAPAPAMPAAAQPPNAAAAAQPLPANADAAPAGLAAGFEKALAAVSPPSPTTDASAPAASQAPQPGGNAVASAIAAAAPGDIALVALTVPPNAGAKAPAAPNGSTPHDAGATATAATDAAPSAAVPLTPAAVPAAQAPSSRLSDTPASSDSKAAQGSAGKPDAQAAPTPAPTAPAGATATPNALPADVAGTAASAPTGTASAPDPSLTGAATPPPVAPVADAQRAQAAYTAASGGGTLPQVTLNQVVLHLAKAADDGLDQLTIHLKPAELGAIEVKLEMGDDGLSKATITADRPDTLNLLQQDSHRLAQALDNAGIKTDPGTLSFNLRGDGGGGRFAQGFAQGFAQQQGGGYQHAAPAYVPRTLNDSPLPDSAAILGYLNTRAALGGVDIRV